VLTWPMAHGVTRAWGIRGRSFHHDQGGSVPRISGGRTPVRLPYLAAGGNRRLLLHRGGPRSSHPRRRSCPGLTGIRAATTRCRRSKRLPRMWRSARGFETWVTVFALKRQRALLSNLTWAVAFQCADRGAAAPEATQWKTQRCVISGLVGQRGDGLLRPQPMPTHSEPIYAIIYILRASLPRLFPTRVYGTA
jgi:hypothetical protein